MTTINGLHHITSISGSARNNARFYTEILGLQFVKKTINYDSPDTWHLYYGNKTGEPGSITTFFPFPGITRGKSGNKSITSTMFSIGSDALGFWMNRLKTHQIEFRGPYTRFNEEYIHFEDFDGIHLELVANATDSREGCSTAGIPIQYGIKGLYSVTLSYASAESTLDFLTKHMQHIVAMELPDRTRLFSGTNRPGNFIDLISRPSLPNQIPGSGTVHHLAFQTADETSQKLIHSKLMKAGLYPSAIMDRQYFKSIYFREPGGITFEIATAGPGFLTDESLNELGKNLMLPSWLENKRNEIEAGLSPF
jgi:glyoxalase family protein